jgi:hypothetical protein
MAGDFVGKRLRVVHDSLVKMKRRLLATVNGGRLKTRLLRRAPDASARELDFQKA